MPSVVLNQTRLRGHAVKNLASEVLQLAEGKDSSQEKCSTRPHCGDVAKTVRGSSQEATNAREKTQQKGIW